jgi:hypothetical protein
LLSPARPEDPELEVLVKQKIGASKILYDLHEGDEIKLIGICGDGFDLAHRKGRDLVFVAMGTGVAPLRSALRHVMKHRSEFGQLVVLYGARTPDDFAYRDEVQSWANASVELRQVISRPDGHDWSGPTGLCSVAAGPRPAGFVLTSGPNLWFARNDRSNAGTIGQNGIQTRRDPYELLTLRRENSKELRSPDDGSVAIALNKSEIVPVFRNYDRFPPASADSD